MVLIPWRCYRDFSSFTQEMNQLFDRFFGDELMDRPWEKTPYPRIQITETEDEILVRVETQNFAPEEFQVTFADNLLIIKGEKIKRAGGESNKLAYLERRAGSFVRTMRIQQEIHPDAIRAHFKDGVLAIILPKAKKKPAVFKIAIE